MKLLFMFLVLNPFSLFLALNNDNFRDIAKSEEDLLFKRFATEKQTLDLLNEMKKPDYDLANLETEENLKIYQDQNYKNLQNFFQGLAGKTLKNQNLIGDFTRFYDKELEEAYSKEVKEEKKREKNDYRFKERIEIISNQEDQNKNKNNLRIVNGPISGKKFLNRDD